MRELNYEQLIEKIENTHRFGNKPGVEITANMLEKLEFLQKDIPYIHVAGTNGKGSTCAFLASILREAGLKVGVFTSPHLIDFEERIVVDGQQISREDVVRIGNLILDTEFDVTPTYFDYCLAIGILYFKEQKCDVTIIETGLGGALDSTNALGVPEVSVITKIGFDHMSILGDTLSQIASEKAGIIKNGSYVVMERQEAEARQILENRLIEVGIKDYAFVNQKDIDYTSRVGLSILGVFQYENAAAAMLAAKHFLMRRDKSEAYINSCIEAGLKSASWQGRMEILSKEPFVMVDGAHNGHGVAALKESLLKLFPDEKFSFYLAVMADKDYPNMIEEMLPMAHDFTTVTLENERAALADKLAEYITAKGIKTSTVNSTYELIKLLKTKGERKNIVFGSLYFIGEVKKHFKNGGFWSEEYTKDF